jgi:hypothetical protein
LQLKARDAFPRSAPTHLELGFTRASAPDAAGQTRKGVVSLAEARKEISHLRELDLQLSIGAFGVLSENVEDELCTIDDLEIGQAGDVVRLRRSEVVVEDERLCIELHGADHHILELAAAENVSRVHAVTHLQHAIDHFDPRSPCELRELSQRIFGLTGVSFVADVHEDRSALFGRDPAGVSGPSEFLLERRNDLRGAIVGFGVGNWAEGPEGRIVAVPGDREVVAIVHAQRPLFTWREADGDDHVEPQAREIDQVVPAQWLVPEMGMNESETAKPSRARTKTADVGQHELRGITHDHVVHSPAAVDQHTHLPSGGVRNANEGACELRRRQPI